MGGYSSEIEISLGSGSVVCELLDANKYYIYPVHILKEGWNYIDSLGEKHPINKADFSFFNGNEIIYGKIGFKNTSIILKNKNIT